MRERAEARIEASEALILRRRSMLRKLSDCAGDCVVEAAIKCSKLIDRDRRAGFEG